MDTGLSTLIAIARFHQLPAEPGQIAHQFGKPGQPFSDSELLQAAKALTLKTKRLKPALADLDNSVLPAIAKLNDGSYVILARVANPDSNGDQQAASGVLVHDLRENSPKSLALDAFNAIWSGELILLARRQGLGESLQQKFDISWFIPGHRVRTVKQCDRIIVLEKGRIVGQGDHEGLIKSEWLLHQGTQLLEPYPCATTSVQRRRSTKPGSKKHQHNGLGGNGYYDRTQRGQLARHCQ
jgi:ABC-type bacteriocin/lantibiotic exporter with double-glycine peptidase domain